MTKYRVIVPPTNEQSSFKFITSVLSYETKSKAALEIYNDARDHDGQLPLMRMPKGTKYIKLGK